MCLPNVAYELKFLHHDKKIVTWVGLVCVAMVGVFIAMIIYASLDESGWIQHDRTLDVYMSNNWLLGENRVCSLSFNGYGNGNLTDEMEGLWCPNGDEKLLSHNIKVTFKGVIDHKENNGTPRKVADQWRCTRGSDKFICESIAPTSK
jgi:hypothetical protein